MAQAPAKREAADKTRTLSLPPLNRFSRVVHEWFVERVREVESRGAMRRAALKTKVDAEAYVNDVREKIRQSFGPEPARTPLNPRVTRVVEREAYRIENVIFESRPGFFVTGNLYLPAKLAGKAPAVVGVCGHSGNGKAEKAYQSFVQSLARRGYVAFIIDPIGQGERLQYVDADFKPRRGVGVAEHLYAGNQQFLTGEFFGAWRAWDGIRALDYLLSRPEVDETRVGITGNSGGGTLTTWLAGLDRRWAMAAPSCFVTTFRRNLENELPADTEQCPPRALALGLDHADFLAAMAPKPVIVLAKERDYFDARGSIEAYERLKHLYTLLGAPDNVGLFIGPTEHGYTQENREAMYGWFHRAAGVDQPAQEPTLTLETDETLTCTARGQVAELKGSTVFDLTKAKAERLRRERPQLRGELLRAAVREVLGIAAGAGANGGANGGANAGANAGANGGADGNPLAAPDYRILRPYGDRGYPTPHATTYAVETEPRMIAVVTRLQDRPHYSRPQAGPPRALLYVAHQSSDAELRGSAWIRELAAAEPETPFFACDPRGIGESRPDTCGADNFSKPYGADYFYAIHSLMLDQPYIGRKTFDILRVIDWLAANGHRDIHLAGQGWGTLPAVFAAVLSDRVSRLSLRDGLDSYASLAENEEYNWPLSSLAPNVLAKFDLPDCYAYLAERMTVARSKSPAG
jgi:cephalosporin-C deacetylase-like acetyl esterase